MLFDFSRSHKWILIYYYCVIKGLSRTRDGVIIAEIDLNLCRQTQDTWGFKVYYYLFIKIITKFS